MFGFFLGDVAEGNFAVVGFVGFGGLGIPLGGEDAFAAEVLHRDAETADSGEEVDEGEFRFFRRRERNVEELRKEDLGRSFGGGFVACFFAFEDFDGGGLKRLCKGRAEGLRPVRKNGFLLCGNVERVQIQFREEGFCLCGICGNPAVFCGDGNGGLFFVRIFSGTHRSKFYR